MIYFRYSTITEIVGLFLVLGVLYSIMDFGRNQASSALDAGWHAARLNEKIILSLSSLLLFPFYQISSHHGGVFVLYCIKTGADDAWYNPIVCFRDLLFLGKPLTYANLK